MIVERLGDAAVPRAVAAGPASVGEHHRPDGAVGDRQLALQEGALGLDAGLAPSVHGHLLG